MWTVMLMTLHTLLLLPKAVHQSLAALVRHMNLCASEGLAMPYKFFLFLTNVLLPERLHLIGVVVIQYIIVTFIRYI